MRYLSIRNLRKHQHYGKRRPPWIKLHAEVFDDYAFVCLHDASKAHLMLLWLLASQMDNRIPYDLGFISRKIGATTPIDVEELVLQGFIEVSQDDSAALASRKQSATLETETETEGESEAEAESRGKRAEAADAAPVPDWVAEGVAWWSESVGRITPARFRRVFGGSVAAHGWERVFPAVKQFVTHQRSKKGGLNPDWFVREDARWIAEAEDEHTIIGADGNEAEIAQFLGVPYHGAAT